MSEYIIGIIKEQTGRVLYWDGVFSKEELQTRLSAGNLPEGFKIYELREQSYTTQRKTITIEVDEITLVTKLPIEVIK